MYPELIQRYFDTQKPFTMAHELSGATTWQWRIHGLDFHYGVAEIKTQWNEEESNGDITGRVIKQAIALDKLLALLENQS